MKKLAVVGAGSIGKIHASNIARHADAELTVVCDTNREAARSLADEHGAVAVVKLDDLFDRDVDGVIIASSTASHGDVAKACVATRTPFLCEKPLASDLETGQQIVAAVQAEDVVAAMAFNRRFDRGYADIRTAVHRGEIGRVEAILVTSRTASPPSVEFTRSSGGLYGEKGAHFYDLIRWITGEHPVEVFTMGAALIDPEFADIGEADTAMITMRLPSGALCQMDFSWRAAYGQDERLEVNGSLGMLQTLQAPVGRVLSSAAKGTRQEGPMPGWYERFAPTYLRELDLFLSAIRSGELGELPPLADGLAAQQITDAARQSFRDGQPVTIELMV